jgi:hypothetical protein
MCTPVAMADTRHIECIGESVPTLPLQYKADQYHESVRMLSASALPFGNSPAPLCYSLVSFLWAKANYIDICLKSTFHR